MAKKKTKKDTLVPVSLLQELMIEILLRLPVRFLLRFKCVCKSWLSLISDPQFTKSHFDLGAAPTYRLLFTKDLVKYNSIDTETLLRCHPSEVILNFPRVAGRLLTVVGYCRGFMLMQSTMTDLYIFVIWNPFTGLQRRILRNKPLFNGMNILSPFLFGMGYDSSTDDYVIVIIMMFSRLPLRHIKVVECYSVRTNSWSCTKYTFPYHHDITRLEHGLFLNGALHWILRSDDNHRTIIAFDVVEKKFAGISLPHDVARSKSTKYLRVTGGGRLCIISVEVECYYKPHKFAEIWMMKQYREQSSWTKLFVLSTDYFRHFSNFFPICFTENDEILGSDRDRTLVRLNDKGKLLDHRTRGLKRARRERFPRFRGIVCRESLLSLPGPEIT